MQNFAKNLLFILSNFKTDIFKLYGSVALLTRITQLKAKSYTETKPVFFLETNNYDFPVC